MKGKGHTSYRFSLSYLRFLPVLVWLAAVGAVVILFYHRSQRFETVGMARGQVRQIAATCTARLESVPVQLFEEVKTGQTVAVMNTILDNEQMLQAELKTQLATAQAEIERLMAQLVAAQDTLLAEKSDRQTNRMADKRRFAVDIENARLQILGLKTQMASDRIVLEDLAVQVKITQDLLAKEAVAPYALEQIKVRYNCLAKKIEEDKRTLEQANKDLQEALSRRDEYAKYQPYYPSVDGALDVIRKEANVQEQLMEGLLTQLDMLKSREAVELKSPMDGVVIPIYVQANDALSSRPGENVLLKPGEVVMAGDPILAIAETEPSEIIAYVTERQLGKVQVKASVKLIKTSEPAQIAMSTVAYVGPTMELMPSRLWRNPNFPQWGRPVVINIPEGMKLVPGELVGIRVL